MRSYKSNSLEEAFAYFRSKYFKLILPRENAEKNDMKFVEKFEDFLNAILIKIGELLLKCVPKPFRYFYIKLTFAIKRLPKKSVKLAKLGLSKTKETAKTVDIKTPLVETYRKSVAQMKESSQGGSLLKIPILMMGMWLKGLNVLQVCMMLLFTTGSILAVVGIGFSGKKIASDIKASRAPAAVPEEEVKYNRPDYYKEKSRHFHVANLRLPVHIGKVNELISVDIDITATTSNRNCRLFLEKSEFQLRDHLILQLEPSIPSFPLEEEGKDIIRKKLQVEINDFLKLHEIEGEVEDLKITYILGN